MSFLAVLLALLALLLVPGRKANGATAADGADATIVKRTAASEALASPGATNEGVNALLMLCGTTV